MQPPKYLNDFSKALATEVRILLAEVGKLRDERRALQYEIAELMQMKSKHGAGGEFAPDWRPSAPMLEAPPPPPAIEGPPPAPTPAPPGWRVVHKRPERKPRMIKASPPVPAPAPVPAPPPPKPEMPAWAQWRRGSVRYVDFNADIGAFRSLCHGYLFPGPSTPPPK
ncbi:hypothetical protein J132_09994 [Termitomyces sp. J132]|nr:hypothetical protein J132_09994 [Termitomyces sp. J132]